MKKVLILLFLIILGCNSSKTTTKKTITYHKKATSLIVEYNVSAKPRKLKLNQKGILIHQNNLSKFQWAFGKENMVTVSENGIIDGWYQDEVGNVILKNFKTKKILQREIFLTKPYLHEEKLPKMKWVIKKQKKQIENFECTRAILNFRGRSYEAWFAPKIPIQEGPWKFHGLPGLILEISDLKKEYSFIATSIKYPVSTTNEIVNLKFKEKPIDSKYFYNAYINEFIEARKKTMSRHQGKDNFKMSMIKYNPQEIFNNEK